MTSSHFGWHETPAVNLSVARVSETQMLESLQAGPFVKSSECFIYSEQSSKPGRHVEGHRCLLSRQLSIFQELEKRGLPGLRSQVFDRCLPPFKARLRFKNLLTLLDGAAEGVIGCPGTGNIRIVLDLFKEKVNKTLLSSKNAYPASKSLWVFERFGFFGVGR